MASIPRYRILYSNCYFHLMWQCHNNSFYFRDKKYKDYYYNLLLKYKDEYKVSIYSYCIMDSHVHFTGHCEQETKLSDFVRVVNSLFARYFNRTCNRKGQVCMDRFKSPVIENEAHLLNVMRYIDLNPVRAHMVKDPQSYKYSSYNHYAYGKKDLLITDSPAYLNLSERDDDEERQKKYREMVEEVLKDRALRAKKESFSTTLFIGNPNWVIEKFNSLKSNAKKTDNHTIDNNNNKQSKETTTNSC